MGPLPGRSRGARAGLDPEKAAGTLDGSLLADSLAASETPFSAPFSLTFALMVLSTPYPPFYIYFLVVLFFFSKIAAGAR